MKKTVFVAVAALFAVCGSVSADELKINGEFKAVNAKTNLPERWNRNGVKTAVTELVRKGDDNILKIKNEKGYFAMYNSLRIPAKAGDTFKFEIKVKGKGELSVGYYAYGSKGHSGTGGAMIKVDSSLFFKEYKGTFTVAPPYKGKDISYIHIQFGSYKAVDIEVEEIEVEPVIVQ
ncbi:MAG: hypothetical protein IKA79_07970 [Lentisphaeria bacterium]|nr:hypothetical protein [Lentisphaeria bacterium]